MILPSVYLGKEAMFSHHFLERNEQFLHYRLIYDRRNVVPVTLPAPYLFDYQAKGRYVVTREEATEYERGVEAARQHVQLRRRLPLHLSTTPVSLMDISQAVLGIKPT